MSFGEVKRLLASGDARAAEALLLQMSAAGVTEPRLHFMRALALAKLGRAEDAAEQAVAGLDASSGADEPDHSELLLRIAQIIEAGGDAVRAAEVVDELAARHPDLPAVWAAQSALCHKLGRWAGAAAAAERGCRLEPSDLGLRYAWARALAAGGDARAAISVIEGAPDRFAIDAGRISEKLLALEAGSRASLGDANGALRACKVLAALRPDDERALTRLHFALQAAGRPAEAEPVAARLNQARSRRLPSRLADALGALAGQSLKVDMSLAAARWAWELADRSAWDLDEWRQAVGWAAAVRSLLKDYWANPRVRMEELVPLVDPPDLSEVRAVIAEGRGCVIAGSHLGPTAAVVAFLQSCGLPFRVVAPAGTETDGSEEKATVIPVGLSTASAVRTILSELDAGAMIGVTGDTAFARDAFEVEFLGRSISVPAFPSKLIRRRAAASFWCTPVWRGERVAVQLERLPQPDPMEPAEVWHGRWYGAYLARAEKIMRGDPRNLDLRKSIWANLNSVRPAASGGTDQPRLKLRFAA